MIVFQKVAAKQKLRSDKTHNRLQKYNQLKIMLQNGKLNIPSKRDSLKLKLKGSLDSFKLNINQSQTKELTIADRTPQPCRFNADFDDMYVLGKKLGEGASGSVYTCTSKKDSKVYAVKISRGDVELLRISQRTFKIMKKLSHPNIIKAKSLFLNQITQKMHFIMQYCPYPSLASVEYNLSYEQKKTIVKQLINTILYLHSEGICHRDIKLDNILYNEDQEKIKLIDFGISKKIYDRNHKISEMWTSTGTLHYMAPEMISGGSYGFEVDMWALGVLIYKLFYGSLPFDSEYKSEMIDQIINSQPRFDQVDPLLNDFLKHLICKNPSQRLKAVECLRHPWIQNEVDAIKQRLGSGDDIDLMFQIRNRHNSVNYIPSPDIKQSKEDKIADLKQLFIFQQKRFYGIPSDKAGLQPVAVEDSN